jgi:uncharacterized delta-60 repeat protein
LATLIVLAVGSAQAKPGTLDPSFGTGGVVTTPFGSLGTAVADAAVVQPDGKIVAAGYFASGTSLNNRNEIGLARYLPDGSLDTGFGYSADGRASLAIGPKSNEGYGVALQPDGKILVAGASFNGTDSDFALARFTASGAVDSGFGSSGSTTTPILSGNDVAEAVALQPDGKIIVGGYTYNGSNNDFAIVRYTPDGSVDSTFTGGGAAITPIGPSDDEVRALAVQPDGKIVAAGWSFNGSNYDFALVRYTANGSLDSSFGTNGKVVTPIGSGDERAFAVALQPDGKIVAAGRSHDDATGTNDFAVVRYKADGTLDSSFGSGGIVTTSIGTKGASANAVAVQPDGKIVAAGSYLPDVKDDFAAVRYNPDGSVDGGFGTNGKVTVHISDDNDDGSAVVLQQDGKIVVVGTAYPVSGNEQFALVRLLGSTLNVSKAGSGSGTVGSSPAGISCGSTCSAPFAAVPVTLTATPAAGSAFSGWSGGGCSGTGLCQLQLSSDQQVTATFTRMRTLTVRTTGLGNVTSSPAGINCGSTCSHAFADGSSVALTALAAKGYVLTAWGGDCSGKGGCTLQMSSDRIVSATFKHVCVVPRLNGKRLAAAKRAIKRAYCSVGRVGKAYSAKVKKGRVISQKPRPGSHRSPGAKVSLKISQGSRR